MTSITELLALEVSHLESKRMNKVEVNERAGWSWQMRRHKAREGPTLDTEQIFLLLVSILV